MRISDWSSDVCSSDLNGRQPKHPHDHPEHLCAAERQAKLLDCIIHREGIVEPQVVAVSGGEECEDEATSIEQGSDANLQIVLSQMARRQARKIHDAPRSEEHTSELQSLMRISYAVFCLKKTNNM